MAVAVAVGVTVTAVPGVFMGVDGTLLAASEVLVGVELTPGSGVAVVMALPQAARNKMAAIRIKEVRVIRASNKKSFDTPNFTRSLGTPPPNPVLERP